MDAARLRDQSFFSDLEPAQLERLATVTDEITVPAGTTLIEEGRFAYEFVLIEEGSADVLRDGAPIASLGPGDFFGEIGAIRDTPRNASVVASTDLRAIVMTARDLRAATRAMPAVAARLEAAIEARTQDVVD